MSAPYEKILYHGDETPGLQVDTSSQLPEVVPGFTRPEAAYDQQQWSPQQHQQQHDAAWSTYHGSQGGWTSVSQRGFNPSAPSATMEIESSDVQKTILGLPRRRFWLIIGPLLGILVIGLAVGLGVGLSVGPSDNAGSSNQPPKCPNSDGTIYTQTAEDGGASYRVMCNVDYNGSSPSSGTVDLANAPSQSVVQCMQLCSETRDCVGAWYGDYYGFKCFLKSKLGTQGTSPNSVFVVKQ